MQSKIYNSYTYKKRKSNPSTTQRTVIQPQEKRRKKQKGRKRPMETNPKQLRKWQQEHTH